MAFMTPLQNLCERNAGLGSRLTQLPQLLDCGEHLLPIDFPARRDFSDTLAVTRDCDGLPALDVAQEFGESRFRFGRGNRAHDLTGQFDLFMIGLTCELSMTGSALVRLWRELRRRYPIWPFRRSSTASSSLSSPASNSARRAAPIPSHSLSSNARATGTISR